MKAYAAVYETDDGGMYDESDPAWVLLVRPSNSQLPAVYADRETAERLIAELAPMHTDTTYKVLEVEL